jgi:hypothetical protein
MTCCHLTLNISNHIFFCYKEIILANRQKLTQILLKSDRCIYIQTICRDLQYRVRATNINIEIALLLRNPTWRRIYMAMMKKGLQQQSIEIFCV